jgi:hypothetical protein
MKKYLVSLILLITTVFEVNAQTGNVIIFSENGEQFTIILNGIQQDSKPSTSIKMTNLSMDWFTLGIVFADANINKQKFNLGVSLGNETSYALHKKINGDYSLRNISETPLAQAPPTSPSQLEVPYTTVPAGTINNASNNSKNSTIDVHGNSQNGGSVFGINSLGSGVGISVSGVDVVIRNNNNSSTNPNGTDAPSSGNPQGSSQHYNMPGYDGPLGCPYPISKEDFYSAKATISFNNFEEERMESAKKIIRNSCLAVSQLKDLIVLFSFENTRLEFAKFAYDFTFDQGNYYKLNDAFAYQASIDELNKYIITHDR